MDYKINCLHDDRPASGRGICEACRTRFKRQVNAGKTTWKQLEKEGKILPKATANSRWFGKVLK